MDQMSTNSRIVDWSTRCVVQLYWRTLKQIGEFVFYFRSGFYDSGAKFYLSSWMISKILYNAFSINEDNWLTVRSAYNSFKNPDGQSFRINESMELIFGRCDDSS